MVCVRPWKSPLTLALGTGLSLCALTLVAHVYLAGFEHGDGFATSTTLQLWSFGGMFLFGAIPAYLSARYRVVSPVAVAVAIYGLGLATSWSALIDSAQSAGAGITPTWFDFLLWFWPALLLVALLIGGIEYGIRRAVFNNHSPATP